MGISSYVSRVLCEQGIIKKEEEDTCRYGLEVFLSSVFEVLSVIVISAFAGNFLHTIIFFASFLPLRIYAGGYHADTKLRCYLILLFVYALFWCTVKIVPDDYIIPLELASVIFSVIVICVFSPVIHKNRSVTPGEKVVYRKISLVLMVTETLITLTGMYLLGTNRYILSVSMGQLAVSTSMIAALVKSILQRR